MFAHFQTYYWKVCESFPCLILPLQSYINILHFFLGQRSLQLLLKRISVPVGSFTAVQFILNLHFLSSDAKEWALCFSLTDIKSSTSLSLYFFKCIASWMWEGLFLIWGSECVSYTHPMALLSVSCQEVHTCVMQVKVEFQWSFNSCPSLLLTGLMTINY